jgi:hypothetical protein
MPSAWNEETSIGLRRIFASAVFAVICERLFSVKKSSRFSIRLQKCGGSNCYYVFLGQGSHARGLTYLAGNLSFPHNQDSIANTDQFGTLNWRSAIDSKDTGADALMEEPSRVSTFRAPETIFDRSTIQPRLNSRPR